MAKRGRPKKKRTTKDLLKLELERGDIEHIILQLEFYGIKEYHKNWENEVDERNEKICKILRRTVVVYPKKIEITAPLGSK